MRALRLKAWIVASCATAASCYGAEPPGSESPPGGAAAEAEKYAVLGRLHAMREMAHNGKAAEGVEDLLRALDSPIRPLREGAVMALTEAGEPILRPLIQELPILSPDGAQAALRVIDNLRSVAPPEIAAAVWALSTSTDEEVVRRAGATLERLGPRTAELTPRLVAAALDEVPANIGAADCARRALRGLGAEFYRALPPLAERLRQPVSGELLLAIEDLLGISYPRSPPAKEREIVPSLVELARHPSGIIHRHAMMRLATLGKEGAAAVPELEKTARDESAPSHNRYYSVRCLAKIVGAEGIGTIAALRDVRSPEVRGAVVVSLAELGPSGAEARRALEAMSKDENDGVRSAAQRVLAGGEAQR